MGYNLKNLKQNTFQLRAVFFFFRVCAFCIDFQEFNTADDDDDDAVQPTQTQFRPLWNERFICTFL